MQTHTHTQIEYYCHHIQMIIMIIIIIVIQCWWCWWKRNNHYNSWIDDKNWFCCCCRCCFEFLIEFFFVLFMCFLLLSLLFLVFFSFPIKSNQYIIKIIWKFLLFHNILLTFFLAKIETQPWKIWNADEKMDFPLKNKICGVCGDKALGIVVDRLNQSINVC